MLETIDYHLAAVQLISDHFCLDVSHKHSQSPVPTFWPNYVAAVSCQTCVYHTNIWLVSQTCSNRFVKSNSVDDVKMYTRGRIMSITTATFARNRRVTKKDTDLLTGQATLQSCHEIKCRHGIRYLYNYIHRFKEVKTCSKNTVLQLFIN